MLFWFRGLGALALVAWLCCAAAAQDVGAQDPAAQGLPPQGEASLAPLSFQNASAVASFIDGAVKTALRSQHIAGASVAVVSANGTVITRGYGRARLDLDADAQTLFRVGSISKTPVWIAIMQLAEAGKLSLEDPVNMHLPEELAIPDEGFEEPVRVRHLMTHSAGFEDSALGHLFVDDPERLRPLREYLKRYRVHRVRPPGELSVYSNYGVVLAGAIIEHESGMDYPTYMEERVLRPLGMATATYREPYPADIAQRKGLPEPMPALLAVRLSDGFAPRKGALTPMPFEYVQAGPAGALSASASDMAAFMGALLDPSRMQAAGVLSADAVMRMREPLASNAKGFGEWRHGFMSFDVGVGGETFGHGGDITDQHSIMLVNPELGVGVFVAVNTLSGVGLRDALPEALLAQFFAPRPAAERKGAPEEAQEYAGSYRQLRRSYFRSEAAVFALISGMQVTATPEGDLILPGDPPRRFEPVGEGQFQPVEGHGRIAFREVDGRMVLFDPVGLAPLERVGFLQTVDWLAISVALGVLTALSAAYGALRRLLVDQTNVADLLLGGVGFGWLLALGVTGAAMLLLLGEDARAFVYVWPGPLLPLGLWMLAAMAVLTPLIFAAAAALMRERWIVLGWVAAGLSFAVYLAMIATLWSFGMLGYSGFQA